MKAINLKLQYIFIFYSVFIGKLEVHKLILESHLLKFFSSNLGIFLAC